MNVKDLMKQSHEGRSRQSIKNKTQPPKEADIEELEPEDKVFEEEVKLPTPAKQIMRDDVPVGNYGVKAVKSNFNLYDQEIFEWLGSFSSKNQFRGGVSITKSQVIEIMLDVMYYDLEIEPEGYQSHNEFREAILSKIKQM